jgi:hypothetical protein
MLAFVASATGSTSSSSNTVDTSSSLNVQAGDVLVAMLTIPDAAGVPAISSIQGTGGDNALVCTQQPVEGWLEQGIAYRLAAVANSSIIFRAAMASNVNAMTLTVLQFRPDSGDVVELDAGPSGATSSWSADAASGTITTTGTDELVVGFFVNGQARTYTSPLIGGVSPDGSVPVAGGLIVYKIFSAIQSSITATAAMSNSGTWGAEILAIKATASSSGIDGVGGIASTAVVRTPAIAAGLALGLIAAASTVFAPSLAAVESLSFVGPTSAIYAPSISGEITTAFLASTASVRAPSISVSVLAPFVSAASSISAPAIGALISSPLIGSTTVVRPPQIGVPGISGVGGIESTVIIYEMIVGDPAAGLLKTLDIPIYDSIDATPLYWGSIAAAPTANIVLYDYYWDSRTAVLGGGVVRYYTGTEIWPELSSDDPFYRVCTSNIELIADMGAWASAQGSVVAAASAIFEKLSASSAFIASLFANQITVPDGGRIRYYNGQGVQKRCVQLAQDRVDWLDTPNDVVANERLRFRLGRLGVGGAVIADGELVAKTLTSRTESSQIGTITNVGYVLDACKDANGNLHVAYYATTTGYLTEVVISNGVCGSPIIISSNMVYSASYKLYNATDFYICYVIDASPHNLYWAKYTSGSWASDTLILSNIGYYCAFLQGAESPIIIVYESSVTGNQATIEWLGSAWGSPVTIASSQIGTWGMSFRQIADGTRYLVFGNYSTYHLMIATYTGSWNTPVDISSRAHTQPRIEENLMGEVEIYSSVSGSVYILTLSNGSWTEALLGTISGNRAAIDRDENGAANFYNTGAAHTLLKNLVTPYARVGAGVIDEGGAVASGYYEKLGNNTVRQYARLAYAQSAVSVTWTFPVPFASLDYVVIPSAENNAAPSDVYVFIFNRALTSIAFYLRGAGWSSQANWINVEVVGKYA